MVDIFVDANIFLDVMRLRQGWQASARILDQVNKGQISGFVSSLTVTTLFYELKKNLSREGASEELRKALKEFQIAELAKGDLQTILSDERIGDFEDRVQFYSTKRVCNVMVTRNKDDYKQVASEMEVLAPEEFLRSQSSQSSLP